MTPRRPSPPVDSALGGALDAAFAFRDPGPLEDGDLTLVLDYRSPSDPERGWIPAYHFGLRVEGGRAGGIELRVGHGRALARRQGHLGYFVVPERRGHGYAARAGLLLLPLARAHGLDPLWIVCEAENRASRRTCERLGAELAEVGPLADRHGERERSVCYYRLGLGEGEHGSRPAATAGSSAR